MEKVALSLPTAVVSPIISKLEDKAASYFGGDVTKKEVKHLQNTILPKIRNVLRVAEAVPVDELKPWLMTLQDAAYEAEDVLDMYEYKHLAAEVSPPNLLQKYKKKAEDFFAPFSLKTELKNSFEKLQESADQADKLIPHFGINCQIQSQQQPSTSFPPPSSGVQQQQHQQPTTGFPPPSSVFGRDEERNLLVDMLISTTVVEHSGSQRHTPVLAIWGLGGVGKTTLAQHVYNDSRVVEHFDKRVWIHVSRTFNVRTITTQIIESATEGEGSYTITNLDALQRRLKKILKSNKSNKFLLVLDDIWLHDDRTQWDQMLDPLNEVGDTVKIRILVTTRTQELASKLVTDENIVVALKDLEKEHCMSIFKHYSFGDSNKVIHDPELENVAEHIVEMLKKSPLSARMVGSLLRGKTNVAEWEQILLEGEMLNDTLNTLYLSFDNLAPHLQRCFAFCSLYPKGCHFYLKDDNFYLFPKDYFFKVDDLVKLWIAQGFVKAPKDDKMAMENIGRQYFNELVSNSFFQKETNFYTKKVYFVIHDNLHDLAEEVSKGHYFRIEDDSECILETVTHLSIFSTKDQLSHIKSDIFKLVNLHSFVIIKLSMVSYDSIFDGKSEIFEKFKKLRVLHLGGNRLLLHKTIGQLKHIRYLQGEVEEVERLPKSLGRLYYLQFLDLGRGEVVSKIPWFGKLTLLRSIGEEYSASRKKGHGIEQLKNLRRLRGSLCIKKLENVHNKEEASQASLKEKKFLEELTLAWTYSENRDGRIDGEVIKGLEPPPNLNVVRIEGYNGSDFPEWLLKDGCFLPNLSELSINKCPKLMWVPSIPSSLKRLKVSGCENLNKMLSLPSDLIFMEIEDCPNLTMLSPLPPNLKELKIERCENLNETSSLPFGLRVIRIEDCPNLMQLSPFPPNLEELHVKGGCPGVETLLSNILIFEGEDEQPHEEDNQQQHFPLKVLWIQSCYVSGKKRLFSDPNKLFTSLTTLVLWRLPWLTSVFHPDHKLASLEDIGIGHCENLELFGGPLASSPSLRSLRIGNCPRVTMPDMDGSFLLPSSLKQLEFCNCGDPEMNLLERCLLALTSLEILKVGGFSHARSLPDLPHPGAIMSLHVSDCPELTSMWNLQPFSSLTNLRIWGCPNLTSLPANMENLSSLSTLQIQNCRNLTSLPTNMENLSSLWHLDISDCPNLTLLPANMEKLSSLRNLWIERCPKIELLPIANTVDNQMPSSVRRP